jgi:hypothetical protein
MNSVSASELPGSCQLVKRKSLRVGRGILFISYLIFVSNPHAIPDELARLDGDVTGPDYELTLLFLLEAPSNPVNLRTRRHPVDILSKGSGRVGF